VLGGVILVTSHRTKGTPLSREAAACAADPSRDRVDLFRLLLNETLYVRTSGPVSDAAAWQRQLRTGQFGLICLQRPDGSEYLPVFDHPVRLRSAARRMGASDDQVHYVGLEGSTFWALEHPESITGVLLNPGRPGTILIGRFEMEVLATGLCPGDLEQAIRAGEGVEELLLQHPLLQPCRADGIPAVDRYENGVPVVVAFTSTAAFTAYLSHAEPTHIVCKPGGACVEEAARSGSILLLNPYGPATCRLSPFAATTPARV
jgi:hypothetical protein